MRLDIANKAHKAKIASLLRNWIAYLSRLTLLRARQSRCLMGGWAGSVPLDCVHDAFVLAAVFARAEGWVHEYPDGEPAPCSSVRTASPTTTMGGAFPRPECAQAWRRARCRQGQALRARLRASLTAPARDASSAAQAGTRKRPPSRTRKQANPDCEGRAREVGWMKGSPRGRAFPFPFPRAVERWGTGTGNGAPISGL